MNSPDRREERECHSEMQRNPFTGGASPGTCRRVTDVPEIQEARVAKKAREGCAHASMA